MAIRSGSGSIQWVTKPVGSYGASARGRLHSGAIFADNLIVMSGVGKSRPQLWTAVNGYTPLPFLYPNNETTTDFVDINSSDSVVGHTNLSPNGFGYRKAMRWQEIGGSWVVQELPGSANNQTLAEDQDDLGRIVGWTSSGPTWWDSNLGQHTFARTPGWQMYANGIDANGDAIGNGYLYNAATLKFDLAICRWRDWSAEPELTVITTGFRSNAPPMGIKDTNESGQMIGWKQNTSFPTELHWDFDAVIFSPDRGLEKLDDLIGTAAQTYHIDDVYRMNERGQILAKSYGTRENFLGFRQLLLTPVPEPTSLLLLAPGLAWVLIRKRAPRAS